jgi:hypothetical protein
MAEFKIHREYRTYRYRDKNPVIDKIRTIVQDEGLFKRLGVVHELSGVATSTLDNWFHGETRNPQHHTVAAVVTAMGYEETFQRVKTIELDKELEVARKWMEKQRELLDKNKKPKTNGKHRAKKGS